jgi:phosphoserine phosphatase
VFVSDMDSTMIGQECIDELADYAGIKPQIAAITERAMQGELDFVSALRERVGLLADLEENAIVRCLAERIVPMDGARALVATLKAHGCRTVLVTGGFHHFADPVAEQIGFERVIGNRLAVHEGKLTGGLVGAITGAAAKEAALREEMARLGDNGVSLATGDGANDIPMLAAATYGVAFRAKPKARAAANGWLDRGDLTSLLKLLEIPEHAWVMG